MAKINIIKRTLEKALLESGRILLRAFHRPKKIQYKGLNNLVTQTDRIAERVIIDIIRRQFPDHQILAEESEFLKALKSGRHKKPPAPSASKWVIDPVDGTTNFAHGLPIACVSIGFEQDGVMTLGGVWNPLSKELFWAEKGQGAYLNGKRIRVSRAPNLRSSLLVTGFPYDSSKRAHKYMRIVEAFLRITHGIRRLGSAALDLCFLACGRFDGYWEQKLHPWDQAAGYLIALEAGARVSDFQGRPFNIYKSELLATNGRIHAEMLKVLAKFV